MQLRLCEFFSQQAAREFALETDRIARLLPYAEIKWVGTTAIPGCLTKGDLDINVRVTSGDFEQARSALQQAYAVNHPELWTGTRAFFTRSGGNDLSLGISLVVGSSSSDVYVPVRDALRANPALVAELNQLKESYAGQPVDYKAAKAAFFTRLIADIRLGNYR